MNVISATVIVIAEVARIVARTIKIAVDAVTMTPEMIKQMLKDKGEITKDVRFVSL